MATSDDMSWADLRSIIEHTPGATEQVLVHLERTGKIPKQLTKDGVGEERRIDRVDDPAHEMSQDEAQEDLSSRLMLLVTNLRDVRIVIVVRKSGTPIESDDGQSGAASRCRPTREIGEAALPITAEC